MITHTHGPAIRAGIGAPYQFGIVVRNIDQGMARYRELLGLGPFWRLDTSYRARHRDWEGQVANCNAFARWGALWLELVAPDKGNSTAREWLEMRGECLFHLGFSVDDVMVHSPRWPVCFQPLEALTFQGAPTIVHLDTVAEFGFHVELSHHSLVERLNGAISAALVDPSASGHVP